jgi:hypothetical protein
MPPTHLVNSLINRHSPLALCSDLGAQLPCCPSLPCYEHYESKKLAPAAESTPAKWLIIGSFDVSDMTPSTMAGGIAQRTVELVDKFTVSGRSVLTIR